MRIGLIGAGHMASQHAAAYAAMDDVDVVAVLGRGRKRAAALASKLGAEACSDLQQIFGDASIDAVDVTYPTAMHSDVCTAALEAGKHVFCETPLAQTAAEGERMLAAARTAERHLQVALMMRFARPAVDLREAVVTKALGTLRTLTLQRLAPGTGGAHHGDAFEELMLFDLDILQLVGRPDRVVATGVVGPDGRIDHAFATLAFGDVRATCEASYLLPRQLPFTATLCATFDGGHLDGSLLLPRDGPPSLEVTRTWGTAPPEITTDLGANPIVAECRRFADVVHGDAAPALLDASEAVASLRMLDALRLSCEREAWVSVPE